jgi:hypothetical protein
MKKERTNERMNEQSAANRFLHNYSPMHYHVWQMMQY